jgi:hypothetical protein
LRVTIFTEDSYGPAFVKKLFPLLQLRGLIPEATMLNDAFKYIPCNPSLDGMVRSSLNVCERAVVLVDADGKPIEPIRARILNHVRRDARQKVAVVVFDDEIEEWICLSKSYNLTAKASKVLEIRESYGKFQLPTYAEQLDLDKLKRESGSFKRFVDAMKRS